MIALRPSAADAAVRHGRRPLADGREVEIRQLERADREELAASIERLSDRSRYMRFASPKPRLSGRDLDALADIDHHAREALVAVDPSTGHGVAVARFAALPDEPDAVDVAVTVDDHWQRQGLAGVLVPLLLDRARWEGFRIARASVLADNAASRSLLRKMGFTPRSRSGVLLEMERQLHEP